MSSHDGHDHPESEHEPIGGDDREMDPWERRAAAIQALLIEKDVLTADEVRAAIDDWESRTPALGARVVARAWTDPGFKERLVADGKAAVRELLQTDPGVPELVALENTDRLHHVVVCTLCSCYPRAILGFPPAWYKSLPYRSRTIADPRGVLREFGLELAPDVEILAALVTRDSMIGVAEARRPIPA